jgi:PAS domain S-box-containing protein
MTQDFSHEDKWKLALDAAGDGMWDLNMQTGDISFSAKWHDIFGYNPDEIATWDGWVAKIHPEDQPKYKRKVEEYIAGKTTSYSVEQRFLCRDGTYKWILSRGVIISKTDDGKPLRAIGTHHDINERKLAEEALKTSRETFASAFDHSGIGIALISPDGKWLDVNSIVCQMTGYSKEELLQLTHYDVTYPADKDIDRGLIDQMLDKDIYTYSIEKRYISKEKKIVLGLLTVSLVWNSDGTPKFFITQVIDITKKKELENQIKKKNAELETARASLVNKVNELEELNHIIANNLKGPVDKIKTLSEALVNKNKAGKHGSVSALSNALTEEEALQAIADSSKSLVTTLAKLMTDV